MSAATSPPETAEPSSEAGFVLVLFAGLLVVMLGLAAILVDLGQQRANRRDAQSIADMAALGGGKNLSLGNPAQACRDIITYFDANATKLPTKISAASFCGQLAPVDVASTECSGGSGQAKPFMDAPPGGTLSSAFSGTYGPVVRKLRGITNRTVNKEPKWRHNGPELTTGANPRWPN